MIVEAVLNPNTLYTSWILIYSVCVYILLSHIVSCLSEVEHTAAATSLLEGMTWQHQMKKPLHLTDEVSGIGDKVQRHTPDALQQWLMACTNKEGKSPPNKAPFYSLFTVDPPAVARRVAPGAISSTKVTVKLNEMR